MSIQVSILCVFGLMASCATMAGQCRFAGKYDDSVNKRMGPPIIQGRAFIVPSMKWRFESSAPPNVLEIRYEWQWIDHPYPEHPFGAWLTASETVECRPIGASLEVPEWTVRPRGWYNGKYTMLPWSKPRFHQVEVVIEWDRNCRQTVLLSPQALAKFREHEAIVTKSCGVPEEIKFLRKRPR